MVFTKFCLPAAEKKTVLGGIIGVFTGAFLAKSWLKFNRPVLDTLAVAMPISMAISRIGCLMAGCCYGTPTSLPWGIRYRAASHVFDAHLAHGWVHPGDMTSLAVHPAQLYQVAGCLLIAFIVWRSRKQWKAGGRFLLPSC
jgi:prolipoprotein diacylglyceryltransferase